MIRSFKIALVEFFLRVRNILRGYDDYYNFPFDVSTPLNQYAEGVLLEGCAILESQGIPYYVCDGTILGMIRDNRLIPHDNDIDVAVAVEVDIDKLIEAFSSAGYTIGRKVSFRKKIQQLIFYSRQNVIFDICFWRAGAEGFFYHYVPEVAKGRRQAATFFATPEFVNFRGHQYPTHPRIVDWLREHYGENWQTPKSSKGDWRLDVRDIVT